MSEKRAKEKFRETVRKPEELLLRTTEKESLTAWKQNMRKGRVAQDLCTAL